MESIKKIFSFPQPARYTFTKVWIAIFFLLVAADIVSKKLITDHLRFHLSYSQLAQNQPLTEENKKKLLDATEKIDILGEEGKFIKFRLVFNDRFAFSMGPSNSVLGFFISFFAIIFLALYRAHNPELGHPIAWLFIFSGAVGNLIDKIYIKSLATGEWMFSLFPQKGYVTGVVDFIECIWFGKTDWSDTFLLSVFSWDTWPTFNIADSLVTTGITILIVSMIFEKNSEHE